MRRGALDATYSRKRVLETLQLSAGVLNGLIAAGFVTPTRGPRNEHRFSFRDLMLLRTAHALHTAKVPPRKIVRSLATLRRSLPGELPLTGLRITAVGANVTVSDRQARWEAESGQLLMDFEVAEVAGEVAFLELKPPSPPPAHPAGGGDDAASWFSYGAQAERHDRVAAEQAYRRAIALAPGHADAYLNLGAMLCEAGHCNDAAALYEEALGQGVNGPLVHFNHAIALEDQGRPVQALASYERCLRLDPQQADAHYNAGRLLETIGDHQGALRHFSAYRRLQRAGPG